MKYTRRSFLRKYREAPVEIRQHGTQQSQPAQMSDCCRGGMQLISDRFIEPGAEVVIEEIKRGRPAGRGDRSGRPPGRYPK